MSECPYFRPMNSIIPASSSGNVRIEHFEVSPDDEKRSMLRSMFDRQAYVPAGTYTRLLVDSNGVMMSDTPMERDSNREALRRAHGSVLIGGLGLGYLLLPILEKESVKHVTVVEINQDVIDLVAKHMPQEKLEVVHGDIFQWKPQAKALWNTIYFDIWPNICTDNLSEVTRLKRKFAKRLDRSDVRAWMGAWQEDYLHYLRRKGW